MLPTYFASVPLYDTRVSRAAMERVDRFYDVLPTLRQYQRARRNRQLYYGLPSEASPFDVSTLGESGEQGELTQLHFNRLHHLGQRVLTMTVSDDFGWQPVASNGDTSSQRDAIIASSVLEHEKRNQRLRRILHSTAEAALVDGEGWFCVRWDPAAGAHYDTDPSTGAKLYEGRLRVTRHSFFRVACDIAKHDSEHDWVVLTEFASKWDLAARYRALADRILHQGPDHRRILDWQRTARGTTTWGELHDEIPVYTLLHRPTRACPDGRETIFVDADAILFDGPSVYGEKLPARRMSPADMLDTPHGMSPLTDIAGLQQLLNMLVSSAATNNINNGVANIAVPRQANLSRTAMDGANVWEVDDMAQLPQAINLVNTAPETMKLAQYVSEEMTTLVGLNSVSLGQNIPDLSGAAMALLDSKSLQFATLFVAAYRQAVEDLGTAIIDCYKRFAKAPRALEVIVGTARRYMLPDFTGSQVGDISRVTVESRSPLLDTTAGKLDMVDRLLQTGALSGEDAVRATVAVYRGGNLDPVLLPAEHEEQLLQRENDLLSQGQLPPILPSDNHVRHIQRHRAVVASPELRDNPNVVGAHTAHEQAHIDALALTNPALLAALGIQPVGLPMPPVGAPAPGEVLAPQQPEQPSQPSMPTNPATGEEAPLPPVAQQ